MPDNVIIIARHDYWPTSNGTVVLHTNTANSNLFGLLTYQLWLNFTLYGVPRTTHATYICQPAFVF